MSLILFAGRINNSDIAKMNNQLIQSRALLRPVITLITALLITAFAPTGFAQSKPMFAYVTSAEGMAGPNVWDDGSIWAYRINAKTGALNPLPGSPFAPGSSRYIKVNPTGRFAYVPNNDDKTVSAYHINVSTGALTLVRGSPFAAGDFSISFTLNPAGTYAFLLRQHGVLVFSINPTTGALSSVPGNPFAPELNGAGSIAFNPQGTFVYMVTDRDVWAYRIDVKTGALTSVPGSPFEAGWHPDSLTFDSTGTYAYVQNYGRYHGNAGGSISAYRINPMTGALTPIPGSPFAVRGHPESLSLNPAGTFAYVANSVENDESQCVSIYSINPATGALSPVPGGSFAAGLNPVSFTLDPTGTFAFVASNNRGGSVEGSVSVYRINAKNGAVSEVSGSPFTAGYAPKFIVFNPEGTFAFVLNDGSQSVSAYRINANTGTVTAASQSNVGGDVPTNIAGITFARP
ncbi:MAG: lactonase family protein [Halothiobacillus sp.]